MIFSMAGGIITHVAMWHVALYSWQWIHQVAPSCNVIRGSGMTCRWIARWQHPAVWHVALGSWHWIRQVAAPCNVAGGSGMTCHVIRPNIRHIGILHLLSIFWPYHCSQHVILHQSAKFYANRTTLSRKKVTLCRFSGWQIPAVLDF